MFGMGFTEIIIIAIIAILFLGPDKLPEAMVEIAKFFRNVKKTVGSAKESLEHELNVADIKEEALNYKKELTQASEELSKMADLGNIHEEIHEIADEINSTATRNDNDKNPVNDGDKKVPLTPPKPEVVTFPKKETPVPKEDH